MSDPQWHYLDAQNQQQGPISGAQIQALAAQGQITQTTQVWAEGMESWAPASQVEGLFAVQTAAAQTPVQSAYAAPASDPTPTGGEYPAVIVTESSFGKFVGLFLGAFAFLIIGAAVAGTQEGSSLAPVGVIIAITGYIMLIALGIFPYIYLYKAWKCLQPGGASITPGKAIGFLFIPFFNYYWIFVSMGGLPRQWNEIMARYENTKNAPRLSIAAFVCMLLLPGIGLFIWVNQIIKGINFMASLNKMSPASNPTGVVGGGLNFGPSNIPTKK